MLTMLLFSMSGGMGMNGMGHGMGNPHNQGRMMGNQMMGSMPMPDVKIVFERRYA